MHLQNQLGCLSVNQSYNKRRNVILKNFNSRIFNQCKELLANCERNCGEIYLLVYEPGNQILCRDFMEVALNIIP